MSRYQHELADWPKYGWDSSVLAMMLGQVRHEQGKLIGRMGSLGFSLQNEALLRTLSEDVVKTSEIEGELLDKEQVRSSVARKLGFAVAGLRSSDRNVDGVVEMMVDATGNYGAPLTEERLLGWHAALFPTGFSGMSRIRVGAWRSDKHDPMQVISGPVGRRKVHYEAPKAGRIPGEMMQFLRWFEGEEPIEPVLRAAIAHLWFVSIHPFEDGNGRIARAIADMALARSEGSSHRFYSMSGQIQVERAEYYKILESTQKGGMDVTPWLEWFLSCLSRSIAASDGMLAEVLFKARFWEGLECKAISERQRHVLNRLLEDFEGKLSSSKWAKLAKCSPDTALRDIEELVRLGALVKNPEGGRSTSYRLAGEWGA